MAIKKTIIFLSTLVILVNGAAISKPEDSYQNISEEDINENLIPHEEAGDIEGLLPPKPDAKEYYASQAPRRESPYVIDNENGKLTLKGEPRSEEEVLSSAERDAIKEVTSAFEKLLTDAQSKAGESEDKPSIHPVVILSDDGIAVELAGVDKKSDEVNIREEGTTEEVETTTYQNGESETISIDDAQPADQARDDEDSISKFFHGIWDVVRQSISFASDLLKGMTAPSSTEADATDAPATESSAVSSPSLVAFEEPEAHHSFPSREFEKGGRDIDSILYGRGIA